MNREYILIRGGGDLASGVAWVLREQGFPVLITEKANPTCVRRRVSFAEAVYSQQITIEGITGRLARNFDQAMELIVKGEVPVLVDPQGTTFDDHPPIIYIDATMNKGVGEDKRVLREMNKPGRVVLSIGLGPGFEAGVQADVVIETHRNASLGQAIYAGTAMPDTGIPGEVLGYTAERVLRAPTGGVFREVRQIGDIVAAGETVSYVGEIPVVSNLAGTLRGLLKSGLEVTQGMKVGDVHPTVDPEVVAKMTDKAHLVGAGVAKVIQAWQRSGKVVNFRENCSC